MADMFGPGFDSLRLHLKASNRTLTGFFIFPSKLSLHFKLFKTQISITSRNYEVRIEPNKTPNWLINEYFSRIRSLIGSRDV